jgi:hypothetical protein
MWYLHFFGISEISGLWGYIPFLFLIYDGFPIGSCLLGCDGEISTVVAGYNKTEK